MEEREPAPAVLHYLLLAAVLVAILGSLLISRRTPMLNDVPDVAHVADIPPRAGHDMLRQYIRSVSYVVPKTRVRPEIAALWRGTDAAAPPPRLGYSLRVVTFVGLPFWAYRENGYSLYLDRPGSFTIGPIGDEGLALLERQAGAPLSRGWVLPYWMYMWGWLAPLAIALFGWFELRAQQRRRATLGLI